MLDFDLMVHYDFAVRSDSVLKNSGSKIINNRKITRKNPDLQVFRNTSMVFCRYATLFGLNPSDRSRISVGSGTADDVMEALLD